MSASTGPVLAAAAITLFTDVIVAGKPIGGETKVFVGAGIAAIGLFGLEQIAPTTAVALSWLVLVSVLFVRQSPGTPAPAEAFVAWYQAK